MIKPKLPGDDLSIDSRVELSERLSDEPFTGIPDEGWLTAMDNSLRRDAGLLRKLVPAVKDFGKTAELEHSNMAKSLLKKYETFWKQTHEQL